MFDSTALGTCGGQCHWAPPQKAKNPDREYWAPSCSPLAAGQRLLCLLFAQRRGPDGKIPRPLLLPAALVFSCPSPTPTHCPAPNPPGSQTQPGPHSVTLRRDELLSGSLSPPAQNPLCGLPPPAQEAPGPTPPTLAMLKGTGPQQLVSWLGIRLCGETVQPAASACL